MCALIQMGVICMVFLFSLRAHEIVPFLLRNFNTRRLKYDIIRS